MWVQPYQDPLAADVAAPTASKATHTTQEVAAGGCLSHPLHPLVGEKAPKRQVPGAFAPEFSKVSTRGHWHCCQPLTLPPRRRRERRPSRSPTREVQIGLGWTNTIAILVTGTTTATAIATGVTSSAGTSLPIPGCTGRQKAASQDRSHAYPDWALVAPGMLTPLRICDCRRRPG